MNAEVGLSVRGGAQEICDGGVEVAVGRDSWVAEDVHQEGVGAVGAVEFHPLPVGSCTNAAAAGMSFGEATRPGGVGADGSVACGMEVAVAGLVGLLFMAEEDAGFGTGGLLVQEAADGGEMLGAGVEVAAQEGGGPGDGSGLMVVRHKNCRGFLVVF